MTMGTYMNDSTHEARINEGFVTMTAALMEPYDVVDLLSTLLDTCVNLMGVEAGGILIADATGALELVASTSEESVVVETMVIAAGAGPCFDSFTTGAAVLVPDIETDAGAWPRFQATALQQGFRSAHVLPMRIRGEIIGVMNLMGTSAGVPSGTDAAVAQSLADVATLGIMQERNFRHPQAIVMQLHHALDTRILIEQAKGVMSQSENFTMNEAFTALRLYARASATTLREVARGVVTRDIPTADVAAVLTSRA